MDLPIKKTVAPMELGEKSKNLTASNNTIDDIRTSRFPNIMDPVWSAFRTQIFSNSIQSKSNIHGLK